MSFELFDDFDSDYTGPSCSECSSGGARAQDSTPEDAAAGLRGFTVRKGGRNAMAGTAERIGSAVGNAQRQAQRQMRRGLELVRPMAGGNSSPASGLGSMSNPSEQEQEDFAESRLEALEEELSEAGHLAFHSLIEFTGETLPQLLDDARRALSRSRLRARQLVAEYPVQTIGAIAGFCLTFGMVLLLRNPRHR